MTSDASFVVRVAGAVAAIVTVLYALQLLARANLRHRLSAGGDGRLVTLIETTPLPGAASLHVIKVGRDFALLGRTAAAVTKIADISEPDISAWLAARQRPSPGPARLSAFVSRFVHRNGP